MRTIMLILSQLTVLVKQKRNKAVFIYSRETNSSISLSYDRSKSIIMRKTAVCLGMALMTMLTGSLMANANESSSETQPLAVCSVKINSFCKAIVQGDTATVKRLIALGEDVNQKSLGMTPAIFAARFNKVEILQLLIENGADLGQKCDKGWTIKKHAELSKATDVLAVLESKM